MEALDTFLGKVTDAIIDPILTLITLAAFVVFVWGVVEFIQGAGNEEKRKVGQQHMIWGIIGLVIIFGAHAIIAVMASSIGVELPE